MKLIKNINVYAPEHLGSKDVLIIGDKIAKIEEAGCMPEIPYLTAEDIIDGSGKILTPDRKSTRLNSSHPSSSRMPSSA